MKRQYQWAGESFGSIDDVRRAVAEEIEAFLVALDGELVHRVHGDSWHAVKEVDVKVTLRGH